MGVEFLAHDEESLFAINLYTKTSDPEEHYQAVCSLTVLWELIKITNQLGGNNV